MPLTTQVRREERREFGAALATVFLVMLAHALLETARDTVFLSRVPAAHLPWLYLVIAALAVAGGPVLGRPGRPATNRRTLVVMQLAAALGTALFLPWVAISSRVVPYGLYVWGGVATAVVLTRFWLILGERLTAPQAKRLYPLIAAGAVAGSLAGFAGALPISAALTPAALLVASAAAYVASAAAALAWWRVRTPEPPDTTAAPVRASEPPHPLRSLRSAGRHPYVQRLAAMLLLAAVSVTLADFLFKSAVAEHVPTPRLGPFLATAYLAFDAAALLLLLLAVTPLVRTLGVPNALLVRPALLLAGGVALTAAPGLAVALALRGADGALRWSLHKTVSELLYVPMTPRLRTAVKEVSDLVAQRGGQALGSLLILVLLARGFGWHAIGVLLVGCAGVWLLVARALRRPYRTLCRDTLNDAMIETRLAFPELDLASLERLLTELNSADDARVIAALDLLAATGRVRVVPALILYHPSAAVVVRALELFAATRRADWLPLAPRVLRHTDVAVRAGAVRALAATAPPPDDLHRLTTADCPVVAALALIAAAARHLVDPAAAAATVQARAAADPGGPLPRAAARALRDWPQPAFAPLLADLATQADPETAREAVRALGALRDARHLPLLLQLLPRRELRDAVRRALPAFGDAAVDALGAALRDPALPFAVRVHVPRALSRFGHQRAADLLLAQLRSEPGGLIGYKILRGLGRLVADVPGLRLDRASLDAIAEAQLRKCFALLHWRVVLDGAPTGAARPPARELLIELLRQKLVFAVERLFRVLGLRDPRTDFEQLYLGVHSGDPMTRGTSHELLEQVVPTPWRAALHALTDDLPDAERLRAGRAFYEPSDLDETTLITRLAAHSDAALAALAGHLAAPPVGESVSGDAAPPLPRAAARH